MGRSEVGVPGTGGPSDFSRPCPVVALGASAGGLEALQAFFEAMPAQSGMAFVIVVHLDPSHVSLLPELIQRKTAMEVAQIEEGMKVRANRVYVVPPDRSLTIRNGVLHLARPPQPRGFHLPIDTFFRSLALDQGASAACVVLSGTGSDGALGAKAIKGEAGLVMVQDEETARFDGMPRSVLATGLADYVLPPQAMPARLREYMDRAVRGRRGGEGEGEPPPGEGLRAALIHLRARTGHDFSEYKTATVLRRIQRRMDVHQIDDLAEYARFLKRSNREVGLLFKELLIGVTSFFRDPLAYEALRDRTFPALVGAGDSEDPLRVWVPGCSTGEEAYSLAILLREHMDSAGSRRRVQIFATDLDEEAVAVARTGRFSAGIAADVGETRLGRFFRIDTDGGYLVDKTIRDTLVFAPQNLIKDPPFSSVDLISCRNVLIYLSSTLQRRLMALFHYALNPDGVLFLGTSETTGIEDDLFEAVDREWKIFRRRPVDSRRPRGGTFRFGTTPPSSPPTEPRAEAPLEEESSFMQLLEAILKRSDHPPCAVVDENDNVVYVHGRTGRFLELAPGQADMGILGLARHGLGRALGSALEEASATKSDVLVEKLRVRHEGGTTRLNLSVRPILERGPFRDFMIVSFLETPEPEGDGGRGTKRSAAELEEELELTVHDLQTALEELETSNEELQSANEELQSANEELQSTNEEVETSKEELQSLHEEAETVNAELQARVEELAAANDDLKNLLDSTQIATIFLDIDLCVRRFTPTATQIIPLAETDVGRPVRDLAAHLEEVDLSRQAQEVLDTLVAAEAHVKDSGGRDLLMRATPYRTVDNVIDGVVPTFQAR